MLRDDVQSPDPEEELRRRVTSQVSGNVPAPTANPVYDDPQTYTPPPGVTPWSEQHPTPDAPAAPAPSQQPASQGITDPPFTPQPAPAAASAYQPPPTPNPADNPYPGYPSQGGTASLPSIVAEIYRTALGRDGSVEDIQRWIAGTHGDLAAIQKGIYASQEAQDRNKYSQSNPPATPAAPGNTSGTRPTGGNLSDPSYAARYVAWAATQPGVNPSVKNDPGYWIGRFTSGAFGNDQNYALQRMMQAEGAPESGAPRASVSAPSAFAATGASAGQQQGLWNQDFVTKIRSLLMQRLSAAGQPVNENDPSISAPLIAARDEATRGSDRERTALAEHLYADGGLNTDAISQKIQQSGEKNALGLGSLRATLITRELQSRRDDLKSLLQMAVQSGDAESAQAIQMQLAELDAQVKREGIGADMAKYAAYLNTIAADKVTN